MKILTESEKIELKKLLIIRVGLLLCYCSPDAKVLFNCTYTGNIEEYTIDKLKLAVEYLETIRFNDITFTKTNFI